ncbi:hypothetical protein F4806DRAFT_431529 [Annulohypoxylon nitens]|nr:hypothetical protein F4806DRAFT_431529 [Annulohypoxylon nitens]
MDSGNCLLLSDYRYLVGQDRHVLLALLGSRNLRSESGLRPPRYHRPSALHPTNIQPQHSTTQISLAEDPGRNNPALGRFTDTTTSETCSNTVKYNTTTSITVRMSSNVELLNDGRDRLRFSESDYCGICGSTAMHERVLALLGNENSTGFLSYTDVFLFHKYHSIIQIVNGMTVCRYWNHERCLLSPEVIIIHADCWLLLRQKCDSEDLLQRMWVFAAWRNP